MTPSACTVIFHDLQHSPALEQLVHERTKWLQQFAPTDVAVRALIDVPHRHGHEHPVRVQLRITVPGDEPITVERERGGDVYALVRDTFDVARRRIQDAARVQRGFVKSHGNATRRVV